METVEGDKAFDEAVSLVQQQMSDYQERTSQKLQKLKTTIEIARKLMLEMMKMKAQQLEEGLVDFEADFAIGHKTKEWPDLTEEGNVDIKEVEAYQESPRYDEVPGEDKEDWHYEELICRALGLEDFFKPKQDFGESNPIVAKVLKCIPDVSIPSASKLQVPRNSNTPLDRPRLQSKLNFTCLNQEVDSSDTYNKRTGELHLPNEILVNYKSNCDEVRGVMQFIVANGRAKTIVVQTLDEDVIARKLSKGLVELFWIGCLVDCSLKTKLFDKRLEIKSDLVGENESGDEFLDSITSVDEGAMRLWSLTATISYFVINMFCNFGDNNVLIFDPGGHESTEVFKMVKEMFGQDVKLDGVAIIILACDQLEQLQGHDIHKVCEESFKFDKIISEINQQYVDYMRTWMIILPHKYKSLVLEQGKPKIDNSTRPEYHDESRKSVQITIFDPGGYIICVYEVQLVGGTAGTLYDHKLLQEVFTAEKFLLKGQEVIVVNILITMYVLQVERSLEVREPP